jgi:aryl-alcohol dehydrogenase-like predicted oxidoreductase
MEYVTLGRTGLRVSVAGLGCGGFSRLGLGTGKSEAEAVALVRQGFDLGVNLLDTAAVYGTEGVVGRAIKTVPRDSVVIATKAWIPRREGRSAAERAVASLDNSLNQLGTDYIDIFQLHGVSPKGYDQAIEIIAPALLKEREKGKLRHLGVTEAGSSDPKHANGRARRRGRSVGRRDGRVPHDAPERPRQSVSADDGQPGRHFADVRGA